MAKVFRLRARVPYLRERTGSKNKVPEVRKQELGPEQTNPEKEYLIYNPDHHLYYYSFLWYRIGYKRNNKEVRRYKADRIPHLLWHIDYMNNWQERKGRPKHNLIITEYVRGQFNLNKNAKRHRCTVCKRIRAHKFMMCLEEKSGNERDSKWMCADCNENRHR